MSHFAKSRLPFAGLLALAPIACQALAPGEVAGEGGAEVAAPIVACGPAPLAPVCNLPKCTPDGWVFWPVDWGQGCQLPGGVAGKCDGGDLGSPGQIEPDRLGKCVAGLVDCPATPAAAYVEVHDAFELNCETKKPGANRTIRVMNDIDLDDYDHNDEHTLRGLPLGPGVALVGTRGGLNEGPTISTDYYLRPGPLFTLDNPGARITGIRLRGPSDTVLLDGAAHVSGVLVHAPGVIISQNEFSRFPHAGVEVWDVAETIDRSNAPTISGNFFHHNQMWGAGYGVVTSQGAYANIVGNLFNRHRHAITSDGSDASGYDAFYNFILPEGDPYREHGWSGLVDHYQQHIDVHGQGAPNESDEDAGHHHGGWAGERFDVRFNTVRGDQSSVWTGVRKAFLLRGVPHDSARFESNVLEHSTPGDAWAVDCGDDAFCKGKLSSGQLPLYTQMNTYGTDTSFKLAVGDFDGDGADDVFQATGATWWVSHGGVTEWRLLNPAPSAGPLKADELGFADVDNDGRTDVLARRNDGVLILYSAGEGPGVVLTTSPAANAAQLRFGDFDGDGKTDIFSRGAAAVWDIWYGATHAWQQVNNSSLALAHLRFGDFDHDGRTDVLGKVNSDPNWLISRGALTAWAPHAPAPLSQLDSTLVGDFDGDGWVDLAWQSGDKWYLSKSASGAPVALRSGAAKLPSLTSHQVGDFDHDGFDDVLYYASHWDTQNARLVVDAPFAISKANGSAARASRYEMR